MSRRHERRCGAHRIAALWLAGIRNRIDCSCVSAAQRFWWARVVSGGTKAEGRGEIRSPRAIFAQQFAELYAAAGNPTLRRVASAAEARMRAARGAGSSPASPQRISDWKAGRNVPARFDSLLPVVLTLIDLAKKTGKPTKAALLDPHEWQRLWQASITWTAEDDESVCPYPGLMPYRPQDSDAFFGRTRATAELAELVRENTGGIVTLIGASGAGKSSLLAAGLRPALAQGSDEWSIAALTPGATPLTTLTDTLTSNPGLHEDNRRLLVIDQFEELFTTCQDEHEREAFLAELTRHTTAADHPIGVVIALRADFYAHCLNYPVLQDSLEHRSYLLGPMRLDELAQALSGPADRAGLKLEPGLEELVITELCGLGDHENRQTYDPGALPLLSHVMAATWQHRDGRKLTVAGYRKAGGVVGSVAATAEQAWSELSDTQQSAARDVLLGLVAVSQDSRDTRRTATRTDLLHRTNNQESATAALELLSRTRLVTLDAEEVYLTHEIVLDAWPRLRTWIDEDRVGYLVRQRLEDDAADWDSAGRDESLLYRGTRLDSARQHVDPPPVGGTARTFLETSLAAHQRINRRSTALKVALALICVAVLGLGFAVYVQNRVAQEQLDAKNLVTVLAEADRLVDTDPSLAAQLYLVAQQISPDDPVVRARLLQTQNFPLATQLDDQTGPVVAYQPGGRALASGGSGGTIRLWDTVDPQMPHELSRVVADRLEVITSVAFSPDGALVVAAGIEDAMALAESPKTTSSEKAAPELWDIGDLAEPRALGRLPTNDLIQQVAFSPTAPIVAAGASRAHVTLWDLSNPLSPQPGPVVPLPDLDWLQGMAFTPDGRILAVATNSSNSAVDDQIGSVQLWNVADPSAAIPLGPPLHATTPRINAIAISADGSLLAVGGSGTSEESYAGLVQVWNITTPAEPYLLTKPFGSTPWQGSGALTFSPQGSLLAIGGYETTLWNLADPKKPQRLAGPALSSGPATCGTTQLGPTPCTAGPVFLAFRPDGRELAAGGPDRVRLWSRPSALTGSTGPSRPEFSADGSRMLSIEGSRIILWDTRNPAQPHRLGGFDLQSELYSPRLSPDGRTVAVRAGGVVLILDVSDPAQIQRIAQWELEVDHRWDYYAELQFSPDWRLMLSTPDAEGAQLWDISDRRNPVRLNTRIEPKADNSSGAFTIFASGVFSPNGRALAIIAGSPDDVNHRSLALWDIADPTRPTLRGQPAYEISDLTTSVVLHPDEHTMLIIGYNAFQTWDISDPANAAPYGDPIAAHSLALSSGPGPDIHRLSYALSQDGSLLVTSGNDATIRLWDLTEPSRPQSLGPSITPPGMIVNSVGFHPSGNYLTAIGEDGMLRLLDLNPQNAADRVCAATRTLLTPELWRRHIPQLPYNPPCG